MARSRRACPERSRRNPGDACWQMLFGAFRPQTTREIEKITHSDRSVLGLGGTCCFSSRSYHPRNPPETLSPHAPHATQGAHHTPLHASALTRTLEHLTHLGILA